MKFLMISRLLYDKGYSEYVEAAKIIKKEFPSEIFRILGSIDEEYPNHVPPSKLEEDIKSGTIEYLGYTPEVKPIIMDADCIVLPSFYNEGLSRVLMEALALRRVIVTSDIPGCRETVDDGLNGFICKPKDVDSLVSCLKKVIKLSKSERIKMGEYGRQKAESVFDISNVISIYHNITTRYGKTYSNV